MGGPAGDGAAPQSTGGATAEDMASRVALPDSDDEDDDLLDDDDEAQERERRRAAAAAGLASDSESGEEVTSPGG